MKKFTTLLACLALAAPITTQAAAELADGEVRKIDRDAGKITLKHGVIKSLEMPGMTMVFQVKDKALLDKVKTGDKVKFSAVSDNGKLVVTDIQAAR
jgi:Cu/Ag efflux protein CusF